jgi:DNA-binding transcriptional regulator YiaG
VKTGIIRKTNQDLTTLEIDFGRRKVTSQHFSRVIVIPKEALLNWNKQEANFVNVKLIEENGSRFIKLTPIYHDSAEEA